jgi:hypothetical protein
MFSQIFQARSHGFAEVDFLEALKEIPAAEPGERDKLRGLKRKNIPKLSVEFGFINNVDTTSRYI